MVQNRICTSQALKKWVSYLTTAPVEAQSSFTSVPVFSGMLGCPDSYGPDDYTNSISWKAAIHSDVPLHLGKLRWTENVQNNKRSFHKFLKVSDENDLRGPGRETPQNAWFWEQKGSSNGRPCPSGELD